MEQLDIYDYLNISEDPIFLKISELDKGESILLDRHRVTLNQMGLYEIEGDETHNSNSTATGIYKLFKKIIRNG